MSTPAHRLAGLLLLGSVLAFQGSAQEQANDRAKEPPLPPPDRAPRLVLAHAGAHAPVNALAFAPDGSTLYVGGFDKQVRRYALVKGKFVAAAPLRVPIGPGNGGVVNALAVSPDGKWVAVAGRAPMRGEDWASGDDGITADRTRLLPQVKRDSGVVYLFDPANPAGGKVIRGPEAGVRAVAFANPAPATGPVLVTAGIEWSDKQGKALGTVRVFDATTGAERASRDDLPATNLPPGIAAWAPNAGKNEVRVVVNWAAANPRGAGALLMWDLPGTPNEKDFLPDAAYNSPLAVRINKAGAAVEVVTGGFQLGWEKKAGGLVVRRADGTVKGTAPLSGDTSLTLPLAVATLDVTGTGDATAVLARVRVPVPEGVEWRYELRLLPATGERTLATAPLTGVAESGTPVLAASPDGRFLAVAGFKDNRVEVYDAAALAAGKPVVEKLAGGATGFDKVAFLAGEKLWLGGPDDTKDKGGVVLDLDVNVRTAAPRAAKGELKFDIPAGDARAEILKPTPQEPFARRVSVTVGGEQKTVTLPEGERATAAAFLPGKPAWDAALGPVLAVAHVHQFTQTVLVTLYDPVTAKALVTLGGPTRPLGSLAFSGTRAVLAGAGEDGTVAVWSLKNLTRKWPAIEGLTVADRGGEVAVVVVRKDVPADGKLKVDDIIESVADAKGVQKPVKKPIDFVFAVRELKVGDAAKIKIKGRAAPVDVTVGARTGFRHPLFTLWVDPTPNAAKQHDWVGWTSSGPYDAGGAAGEARIGWLTATGDPARPVMFAGADQYRGKFRKYDLLRRSLATADYNDALAGYPPPTRPTLTTAFAGAEIRDGPTVTRKGLDTLTVELDDPDTVLDGAELRWQVTGPAGASGWKRESFAGKLLNLDLSKHEWKRGEHRLHVRLFRAGEDAPDAAPVEEVTLAVWFVPPAPELAIKIDGQAPAPNTAITATKPDEVELAVTADAKSDPTGATVTVNWTGGKPVQLPRNAAGGFDPLKIKLVADDTVILVTATNRGAGPGAADESRAIEARVRKPAKVVPPPVVTLQVHTPVDFRTAPDQPFVVSARKVTVTASVRDANPIVGFEWKLGDKPWVAGALDPNTKTDTRDIDIGDLQTDDLKGVEVLVRATSNAKLSDTARAVIRYDGLPDVSLVLPPPVVAVPELKLSGGLKVTSKRRFTVRLLVTSARTGRTREFDPTLDPTLTKWDAGVTLFPGENLLGYVVRYDDDRKELRRPGLVEVRHTRAPLVVGSTPVNVGTGTAGDVALAVVSAPDVPPTELWVNGARVGLRTHTKPVRLFGAGLWLIEAKGVPADPGADRLKPKPVSATVRNAEAESQTVALEVLAAPLPPVRIAPPTIRLAHNDKPITPDQGRPPVGDPRFTFDLRVSSDTPLTRVEVWHGASPSARLYPVREVRLANAVADPAGGMVLTARPALDLRDGPNYIRVVAANAGGTVEVAFNVSYARPPVRVVIDTIREPNGAPIAVAAGNANPLPVAKSVIEVEGRVLWDFEDEPVARNPNLTVVFVANGVAHLPVTVGPAAGGKKERKFKGPVYLNAFDPDPKAPGVTVVRAELRSGDRPAPVPQEGLKQAAVTVQSKDPLRKQRLHVLVIGVQVPDEDRRALVRRVVKAVGGKIPDNSPNFTEGAFERKDFESAYLYRPQLEYANGTHLNTLLCTARREIEERAKSAAGNWVNDVVVIYYQGEDWVDRDTGRWFLHSATTLSGAAGKNPDRFAIRLDNLPQVHGMPVAVVNATSAAKLGDTLGVNLPYLRYASTTAPANGQFLEQFAQALAKERTLGGIAEYVSKGAAQAATLATSLPNEGAGSRVVGLP